MSTPPPLQCQVLGCKYMNDEGITTYIDRGQELLLHVNIVHLAQPVMPNVMLDVKPEGHHGYTRFTAKLETN